MPLPINFATLTSPQNLSDFDTQFAAVAALGGIPCSASGTNSITLTPFANTPALLSYTDLAPSFVFVAQANSTAAVQLNVSGLGLRNAYKWNGQIGLGNGDLLAGGIYKATPLQALNGGAGGFVVDAIGGSNTTVDFEFVIDGGGAAITAGVYKGFFRIPFSCFITQWYMLGDQVGSIVVDVARSNSGGYPPSSSMIGGGNKPTLTSQIGNSASPSGWTSTAFAAGDFIGIFVNSASVVTRVTLVLSLAKT
jgi:hypothetical protein